MTEPNPARPDDGLPFQKRVLNWLMECFSMEICRDGTERNHHFLEESLELVQSLGCTRSEAHQLVDYVFNRPSGEPTQELGGVQVTLAALCFPHGLDMHEAAERELVRVWNNIEKIRAKQAAKPRHSPLPSVAPSTSRDGAERTHKQLLALWDALDGGPKPRCHDCADYNGRCPSNGLPCDPQDRALEQIANMHRRLTGPVSSGEGKAAPPKPAPDALRTALQDALGEIVLVIAFLERDGGTDRLATTIKGLTARCRKADRVIREILAAPAPSPDGAGEIIPDGFCSPGGRVSCLHLHERERCSNCPVNEKIDNEARNRFEATRRSPSPAVAAEPVAWRWRSWGSANWIYDPTPEWREANKTEAEFQPLYASLPAQSLPDREELAQAAAQRFFRNKLENLVGASIGVCRDFADDVLGMIRGAGAGEPSALTVLRSVKRWAESKCPCENEEPNPCPLCSASVENLEVCKAVDRTFPRDLRDQIERALSQPPHSGSKGEGR